MIKRYISIMLLFLTSIFIFSCNKMATKQSTIYAFDTTIEISFVAPTEKIDMIYKDITDLIYLYNDLANRYEEKEINNIYTINHRSDFVEVDNHLIALLKEALDYQEKTSGYFNPLIGNISDIYKTIINTKSLETLSTLEQELDNMNNSQIIINDNQVKIIGDATIDLGAITKGYCLREVTNYLKNHNITNYLLSAGYSSISLGTKSKNSPYRVGLRYDDKVLELKNTTIGCSSMHEQNTVIEGITYHHIVNPLNGLCENHYSTIYLIGEDPSMIDAYVTAFFNMDLDSIHSICTNNNLQYLIYQNDVLISSNF